MPLNIVRSQLILTPPSGGDFVVVPSDDVEDGATITLSYEAGSFPGVVTTGWLHGVGYVVININEIRTTRLTTGSRGTDETETRVTIMIAAPETNSPMLANQYAGALAWICNGAAMRFDALADEGTIEKDMADSGVSWIRQMSGRDPINARPNNIGSRDGWSWFTFSMNWRTLSTPNKIGLAPAAA